ncbi:acyl-CoA dehydrogenase family protein [Rothia halotolerans]|uniref:acyl-CoA dehydrogenase family protein n=1 Tax=Rothia halotolerans TaxID=405770 RepID=UPI00101DF61C|nr:acyl-CoA dehydrogenase family protein [Rothia halotolerans]
MTPPITPDAAGLFAAARRLPLPGRGRTLRRWRTLAGWARRDLVAARLAEAHADAAAISADLGLPDLVEPGSRWGVWAAEPPSPVLRAIPAASGGGWTLRGVKPWCSGASGSTHALVTAREAGPEEGTGDGTGPEGGDAGTGLFAVDLSHPGVAPVPGTWNAVGMAESDSGQVAFDDVPARRLGSHADYLDRPGFWHGGIGVAACWFGGARALAGPLLDRALRPGAPELLRSHAGAAAGELAAGWSLLLRSAEHVDRHPEEAGPAAAARALLVRTRVERLCDEVALRSGRALGPGPLSEDAAHARLAVDLSVYVRQSHAERDEAAVAAALAEAASEAGVPSEGSVRASVEAARTSAGAHTASADEPGEAAADPWDTLIGLGPEPGDAADPEGGRA